MLHDFASELALFRPEDPRKFLYAKLQRELAAEEKAKEDTEERAPALDGQTDCLRVHTECRAGGRVRRGYFVQRAPLLSDPRLEAGGITPAASTRFVSWGAEALAAVKSVVHETAGLQAAGPESAGSTSDAAAASVSEGAQAQLDEAGTDGGAEGDRALTEDNAALARENATLKARLAAAAISTASDGSARPKRPGHDGVGRIIVEDGVMRMGVDPDVEMFIRSLNLEREIASQFAGATLAGVVDMEPAQTASVLRQAMPAMQQTLERAQAKARRVQEAQAAGGAKFGGVLQAFLDGVTGIVGEPAADLEKGMREEHTGMADSETRFSTGNYGLTTCPKHEYELVESGGCGLAGKKVDGSEEERVVVTGTRGACKGGQEGEDLRVLRPLEYCGRCADDGRLAIAAGDEVVVGEKFALDARIGVGSAVQDATDACKQGVVEEYRKHLSRIRTPYKVRWEDGTLSGWLEPRGIVPVTLHKEMKGKVLEINDSGAAKINFGFGVVWMRKDQLCYLRYVSNDADTPIQRTVKRAGLRHVEVKAVILYTGPLFTLYNSESSKMGEHIFEDSKRVR